MKPLSAARIGYAGVSRDFSAPGDRRRFSAYAGQRGLSYEYAERGGDYDVVILTGTADLTGWAARKRREGDRLRLILDLVDGWFEQKRLDQRVLKGVGRWFEGTETHPTLDFHKNLRVACEAADAVWCSTPEQKERIGRYTDIVEISFDWFDPELGAPKEDFRRDGRLKLVWEGQAGTLCSIQTIREPLNAVKDLIELHVVTDPWTPRWYGRFGKWTPEQILSGIDCPKTIYPWSRETFSQVMPTGDLAVIPMDIRNTLFAAKPQNKLILLWKLGLPVLAGPTMAYRRTMAAAGLSDMLCETPEDWTRRLRELATAPPETLQALGRRGREHALSHYDLDAFQRPFDTVFRKLGFEV